VVTISVQTIEQMRTNGTVAQSEDTMP